MADCNKCTKDIIANFIKNKDFGDRSDTDGFTNNAELNKKEAALATKAKLKAEQDKILKLQALDVFDFKGKNHFEDDA